MEDLYILARDIFLSHVSSLRASISLYGFNYFIGTPPVTFCHAGSVENVTMLSPYSMTADHRIQNNNEKFLTSNIHYSLEAMQLLHVEG